MKKPAMCLTQLEEEDADDGKDPESNDPEGIDGVTKEFMFRLARAVKDAQVDEKAAIIAAVLNILFIIVCS